MEVFLCAFIYVFGIVFDKAGEWIFIVFALGKNYTTSTFESIAKCCCFATHDPSLCYV